MEILLDVKTLNINFLIKNKQYPAVSEVDLTIKKNKIVGLVGESGSGKTLTAKSILGILPENTIVTFDKFKLLGNTVINNAELKKTLKLGKDISMIFQDSGSALNPLMKVGNQIKEVLDIHGIFDRKTRYNKTLSLLQEVGFTKPEEIYRMFPHELSGGMRQRIMICIALIGEPELIIADEPTTALDTTLQKQVLSILKQLIQNKQKSLLIITHDLGVINEMCDEVYVMYAGKIIEKGSVSQILNEPKHSYTKALLSALPSLKNKGRDLKYIPFQVPSLKTRLSRPWPYIELTEKNRELIINKFPEFMTKEVKR